MPAFNLTYDLNVTLEQRLAFEMAARIWATLLQDDVEINLHIGAIDGLNGNEAVGGAVPIFHEVNYGVYQEYLANDATSEQDDSVVDALQEGNTVDVLIDADGDGTSEVVDGNTTIMLTRAQAKALGMEDELLLDNGSTWDRDVLENPDALDGYIVINNSYDWSYDLTREDDVEEGQLDFLTMALHEIGHSLGFVSGLDGLIESFEMYSGEIRTEGMTALDLLRYSETSVDVNNPDGTVSDLTFGSDTYFSIDGGETSEANFEGGDDYQASHWQRLQNALGIMDPTLGYQERTDISELDLKAFDVLGWDVDYGALSAGLDLDWLYQEAIAAISEDFKVGVDAVESALENGDDWYSLARGTWWETFKSQMIDLGYGDWWEAFEAEAAALSPGGWWQQLDQQMLELGPGSWWQIFEDYAANLAPGGWWQEFELAPGGWWQEFETAMWELSPGGWWQTFEPAMVEQSFGSVWQVFELQMESLGYGAWWQQFEADLLGSGYDSWWDAFGEAILELGPGGWWQAFEDKVIELYPGGWWQQFEEDLVELVPGGWWLTPGGWWQAFELSPGGWWQQIEDYTRDVQSAEEVLNNLVGDDVETNSDQTMTGGDNDDILAGGEGQDLINGKAGDDLIDGKGGNDIILAGKGNDIAYGAEGNDVVFGDEGDDFIAGENGDDQIFGEAGHDILSGGRGADNISGGEGRDVLKGDTDDDVLDGGAGDDQLNGGSGNDLAIGGTGQDIVLGGAGNDVLYGDNYLAPAEGGSDTDDSDGQPDDQPNSTIPVVTTADEAIANLGFWTRIEAEDMWLWKYKKEKVKDGELEASGDEFISTKWKGSATTTFNGADGIYDFVLGYQDESNGIADITIMVWDGLWLKDSHTFYLSEATGAYTHKISGLNLESGDKIVIWGDSDGDDEARIDYLDILTTGFTPNLDENGAPADGFYEVVGNQENIIQLEVEQMDLNSGAIIQSGEFASNGQYVSTNGDSTVVSDAYLTQVLGDLSQYSDAQLDYYRTLLAGSTSSSSSFGATSLFSGDTGYYDVVVGYYDTSNGTAEISIGIDNKEVDRWYSDESLGTTLVNSDALITRTVAQGVYITYQDLIEIGATSHLGDSGNLDYIQFIEVEQPTETTEIVEQAPNVPETSGLPETIRIEAEDTDKVQLSGKYRFESQSFASGGSLVRAKNSQGYTLTTEFTGTAGLYNIVIGYYDENDGESPVTVNLDGNQLDSWIFDQNLDSNLATANNFVTRTVGNAVSLENGSRLEIHANQESSEFARIDYIEFIAVQETPEVTPAETDDDSGDSNNNDIIRGGDGDDIAYGGEGNDTIYGDAGNDTLYGDTDGSVQNVAPVPTQTFTPTTLTFQQGINGYQGTVDTYVDEYYGSQVTGFGSAQTLLVDDNYGGFAVQSLLRFDDIFGGQSSQIDENDVVTSAILEIDLTYAGDRLMLHNMLQSWSDNATWGSLGNGIQTNDVEAASTPIAIVENTANGTLQIDVTSSLQAWQADPAQNRGWVLSSTGDEGVDFYSSESGYAPRLIVDVNQSSDSTPQTTDTPITNNFDGSNPVILDHTNDLLLNNGTLSFNFNASSVSQKQGLFSKDSYGYDNGGHLTVYIKNGELVLRVQSTSQTYFLDTEISANQNYDVAITFGSNGLELWLDGVLEDTHSYTGGLGITSGGLGNYEPIVLGATQITSGDLVADDVRDHFAGHLSDVRLYDQQLDSSSISLIPNNLVQTANIVFEALTSSQPNSLNGNDYLIGGAGNDTLNGGGGNDILLGTDDVSLGANELDVLTGGSDSDTFILGDTESAYYSQGGDADYALITDFEIGTDHVNLSGLLEDYTLVSEGSDSLLYWQGEDLIARFSGGSNMTLSSTIFIVSDP
ncbi:Hemolysin-type calcium-binding region [[Leptolyngbya] sp. PCC 7376]|uniref:NF038122 family metalloprotease n=1 Tax=[Leptolyngbya] sp. PCC 7376 TaxID=111781 RepID=UPI00029ED6C0|nr:NF038122 family metalloprotease [[Leptolyngbya] sp. PCC 7376]AFY39735.1 Hemolysin-type calcium-binding region [[Leptolyngbya] sp. PCC 7376]